MISQTFYALLALGGAVFSVNDNQGPAAYPDTRRVDQVDVYHGIEVADPYRWLESDVRASEEVAAWVAAQNGTTFAYLEAIPERARIRERLTALWNYEKYSSPFKAGGRYYYAKNDGLQNQSVIYVMEALDGEPQVLLDPNTWSEDGTTSLAGLAFSDDGRYAAYAKSEAGSDWRTWQVMEIASRKTLEDTVKWVRFSGVSWTKDGRGFFYSRFPEPEEGEKHQGLALNQKLYYHRVGTPQDADPLVYYRPDQPEWGYGGRVTEDGRYLIIHVWRGAEPRNRVMYRDLTEPYALPVDLIGEFENEFGFVGNDGPVFYFYTNYKAPRKRVIAIDTRNPDKERWREIIPERDEPLDGVRLVANMFVGHYLKDARTEVTMYAMDGTKVRDVTFPGIGSAWGFDGKRTDTETFYVFSSFATPPSIYRYDMLTGESALMRRADVDVKPDDYEVKQVFYESQDGTRVPMFICHKQGIDLDSANPTLLYGYGGFGNALTPGFSVSRVLWMQMGGVFAMANLRGGGEYGEEWHDAGRGANRQNAFDDFIAAAEWLCANGYTRPDRLAIQGGSNGGLLVGAVMTQRPDLFGACLPAVGVMDMLRFHKFTAGRFWVQEYGSSDDPELFPVLHAYSPYHRIKEGTRYPATLITTADTDDRVVPAHSFKFAAALQHAQAGPEPVLIRIETRAGHGAGKPTAMIIGETADQYAFLAKVLEMAMD